MSHTHSVDSNLERDGPALYMLRCERRAVTPAAIPNEYEVLPLPTVRWEEARAVAGLDQPLTDRGWDELRSRALPGGLFVLRHRPSNRVIGTASAVNNPAGSRFYFPSGGQLAYLVIDAAHRGQGLGYALVAAVVERLQAAGCEHLWLGVQGWRLPAIRTYLRAGYRPFLHAPNSDALATRWMSVFARLGIPGDIAAWPRSLPPDDGAA